MSAAYRLLAAACILALAACSAIPALSPSVTYVVGRRAEKASAPARDRALSDAGGARADALAALLHSRDVVATSAPGFRRTRDTAAPTAVHHDLSITAYDADAPAR